MTDPIDEWVTQSLPEYKKKKFVSAEKGELDLEKVDDKKKNEYSALLSFLKGKLGEKVKEVVVSNRLKGSVACLTGEEFGMSAYMEKILKASGQKTPDQKRNMEINADHPVLHKMKEIFETDTTNPVLKDYSELLFDIAVISEGGKLDDPSKFS